MLNINCSICSDSFAQTDEVYVTLCGHMFHCVCLLQWLARSETCPHCRQKSSERTIIRLFMNCDNANSSRVDINSLQDNLDNAKLQVRLKTQELQKANSEIQTLKEHQQISKNTIKTLQLTVKQNNSAILGYCEQLKGLQAEIQLNEDLRKEIRRLNTKVTSMELVNEMMNASAAEAENLLKNENDPKILSIWVATLKRELRLCEMKKNDMRNAFKVLQNDLRNEMALKKSREDRILELESEVYQLQEKNKSLEKIVNGNKQPIVNNNQQPIDNILDSNSQPIVNNNATDRGIGLQNIAASTATNSHLSNPNLYNNGLESASSATTQQQQQVVRNSDLYNNDLQNVPESTAQPMNTMNSAGQQIIASPGLNECVRRIQESDSPYLNIKSSNVGLAPLMKNYPNVNSNQNAAVAKASNMRMPTTILQNPISTVTSNQYSILKRPRLAGAANACTTTTRPSSKNYAPAGINFYQQSSTADPNTVALTNGAMPLTTIRKAVSSSINKRLRSGYLRDFKISK